MPVMVCLSCFIQGLFTMLAGHNIRKGDYADAQVLLFSVLNNLPQSESVAFG